MNDAPLALDDFYSTGNGEATVTLTTDGRTIACLTCGRIDPITAPVAVTGEAALATQLLGVFAITP